MGEAVGGGEYGRMAIRITHASQLYANEPDAKQLVWMSHGDEVTRLPSGFEAVATSEQVIPLTHYHICPIGIAAFLFPARGGGSSCTRDGKRRRGNVPKFPSYWSLVMWVAVFWNFET